MLGTREGEGGVVARQAGQMRLAHSPPDLDFASIFERAQIRDGQPARICLESQSSPLRTGSRSEQLGEASRPSFVQLVE